MLAPGIAALLALADQRLPSGGHVHSGGVEQAITDGLIREERGLERFLERRLHTTGLVTAGLAAAATALCSGAEAPRLLRILDVEADARTPSPAQRVASRAQGRGLLRTARAAWAAPSTTLSWSDLGARPHHPVVLGCACAAGGVSPEGAALAAAYLSVSAPSTAAQRLLALDPVAVAAVTVRLGPAVERVAAAAIARTTGAPTSVLTTSTHVPGTDGTKAPTNVLKTNTHVPGTDGTKAPTNVLKTNTHAPGTDGTKAPTNVLKTNTHAPGTDGNEAPTSVHHWSFEDLPDDSDPLLDLLAERHAAREERLFAS